VVASVVAPTVVAAADEEGVEGEAPAAPPAEDAEQPEA
jgi:hypothetical protein